MPAGDAGPAWQPVDTAAIRQRLAEISQRIQEHGRTIYVDSPVPLAEAVADVAKTVLSPEFVLGVAVVLFMVALAVLWRNLNS